MIAMFLFYLFFPLTYFYKSELILLYLHTAPPSKWSRVKKGIKWVLKGFATGFSIIVVPRSAAKKWLDMIFKQSDEKGRRKETEEDWVGRFVYIIPKSNPVNIVWGHVEQIMWREHLDGDILIRHEVHNFSTPVGLDNIGTAVFFDSKEELMEHFEKEVTEGKVREGSFRITPKGAFELGEMVLKSLIEHVSNGEKDPVFIPEKFKGVVERVYKYFETENAKKVEPFINWQSYFSYDKILTFLAQKYPYESLLVYSTIDHVYNMRKMALLAEI